jgi:PKD repeat protein
VVYHVYTIVGNYNVTLTVTDSEGLSHTTSKIVNILPISPIADFTWYPSTPKPNQTITFNASSSILGWNGTHHPPIVSYLWDFGDGNITAVATPILNHTYVTAGNYNVTLTVIDNAGLEDKKMETVSVGTGLVGDVNNDGTVNMKDIYIAILAFGTHPGDPEWDPRADLNQDGTVNMADIYIIILNFGAET